MRRVILGLTAICDLSFGQDNGLLARHQSVAAENWGVEETSSSTINMNGRSRRWVHNTNAVEIAASDQTPRDTGNSNSMRGSSQCGRLVCAIAGGKDAGFSLLASSRRWDSGRRHNADLQGPLSLRLACILFFGHFFQSLYS